MTRRLFLDDAPGEARGVVTLDGLPERLLIVRSDDRPEHQVGARLAARVRRIERSLGLAFLDVAVAPDAITPLRPDLVEGVRLAVTVTAPPRAGKGAVVHPTGPTTADPGLLQAAPSLVDQLRSLAPSIEIETGRTAREAADVAEDAALALVHSLPSGGAVSLEPTRALVAIDVDLGSASGDSRKSLARANREAIETAARLLRLKGLGGPVVFDLAGKGHDGDALRKAADAAFAPDQPGVAFGPITRFGLWPLSLPRRAAPLAERMLDDDGRPSVETMALRLLRRIEDTAGPGQRVQSWAGLEVAQRAVALSRSLLDRVGPRFHIEVDPILPRDALLIRAD